MTWTHSICTACWNERNPTRQAHKVMDQGGLQVCCFCGLPHSSGIYIRHDPTTLNCTHED